MHSDEAWFDHRLVLGPRVLLCELFGPRWNGWARGFAPDREVVDGERVDEFTITFERYEDPVEHQLLAELDTSAAVYADWLDEHDRPAFAEMLRLQLEAPKHHPLSSEYVQIDNRLRELATELPRGWHHFATRPLIVLGDADLQFRIGSSYTEHFQQRTVQVWSGRHHLTPFDDTVYVPQFAYSVERDREALVKASASPPSSLQLFGHGPTTDDMLCVATFEGDEVVLAIEVKVYPPRNPSKREEPVLVNRLLYERASTETLDRARLSIRMRTRALVLLLGDVIGVLAI